MAVSTFNRKKQFFAADVEGLIKQLTGLEEDDRRFQDAASYFYYNIIHHNFATVDITKVQQSLEGIAEKFKAHGLNQRAKRFMDLVNKYVSSDSSQHSQLNVQWHVLLLLLRLSFKPTSVSEETLKTVEDVRMPSLPEEDVNWSEYLREGREHFQCPSDHSDNELWLSASDEEEVVQSPPFGHSLDPRGGYETEGYGGISHPSLWQLLPPAPTRSQALEIVLRDISQSEQWLHNNVQHSWWSDRSYKSVTDSTYPVAHTCEIWEKHMLSKYGRDSSMFSQVHIVSEFKVLQEVLWMLQVSTETSLFCLDDEDLFHVRSDVSLPSTVPDTLRSYLENLCPFFDMVNNLRKFEENLNEQEMSENPPPVTYKAYCAALCQQLHKFTDLVISVETRLKKQEETMTLMSVMYELTPGLNILHYLYDIHVKAVINPWISHPPWLCATRLLSVLYAALLEACDEKYLEASLYIFIHSFHVYLDIIDVWLSEGRLEDWRCEFLVSRKDGVLEVMPYEEEMKACGVVPVSLLTKLVTVVTEAGYTMEVVSQLNKLTQLRDSVLNKGSLFKEFSENIYNEIKRLKENVQDVKDDIQDEKEDNNIKKKLKENVQNEKEGNSIEPRLKKSVQDEKEDNNVDLTLDEINSVEDSSERNLTNTEEKSEIGDNIGGQNKIEEESTSEVVTILSAENGSSGVFPTKGEGESQYPEIPKYLSAISNKAMYDESLALIHSNPLLSAALNSYVSEVELTPQPQSKPSTPPSQIGHSGSLIGLMSMHSVMEKQLELVVTKHRVASLLVTQTLRSEYSLLQHFTVLRTVFFMEAGNLAQSFYCYFFKEVEAGTWNNPLSLSVQLQLCVEEYYPGFGNYFSVLIKNGIATCTVHEAISTISLAYGVDWPVSSVISQDTIDSYNKVFRFLLHHKYAYWKLNNIRFSDLAKHPDSKILKRLHVLRMWMYYSTNTLHSYFMGLVLRSYSKHLEQSIRVADSIELIIQAHKKFLEEVEIHCLQDRNGQDVEIFIMKLLKLCSVLANHWNMEVVKILTEARMDSLERKYTVAYRGLVHCLEMVAGEEGAENLLCELRSELAHSVPVPYIDDN